VADRWLTKAPSQPLHYTFTSFGKTVDSLICNVMMMMMMMMIIIIVIIIIIIIEALKQQKTGTPTYLSRYVSMKV
jgi:uncharacterized membrane protein affecting hemolysin expression